MITDSIGHTRGYHLVSTALRDAGMEVVLGGIQVPKEIAITAMQEDVDAIGYHIMCMWRTEPTIVLLVLYMFLTNIYQWQVIAVTCSREFYSW